MTTSPTARTVYLNGKYVLEHEAFVSIFDRGFLFADGVYEVTAVIQGSVLVDFDSHMQRLQRSLNQVGIPWEGLFDDDNDNDNNNDNNMLLLLSIHQKLLELNHVEEGVVYVQVTAGAPPDRSFLMPSEIIKPTLVVFTQAKPNNGITRSLLAQRGMRLISIPDQRWGRCDIKTIQLLYQCMGKKEALLAGVDDAWMVDPATIGKESHQEAYVTEGTSNNAFIILPPDDATGSTDFNSSSSTSSNSSDDDAIKELAKKCTLVTRPVDCILPGITRNTVLRLAKDRLGMNIQERPFTIREAQRLALEAFATSASSFVMPVVELNGVAIGAAWQKTTTIGTSTDDCKAKTSTGPGPITMLLRQTYIDEVVAKQAGD